MTTNQQDRPRHGAKAITWDWDAISQSYDETERCYKLTDRQVAVIASALTVAQWRTRWFNAVGHWHTITAMIVDLQTRLMFPLDCSDVGTLCPSAIKPFLSEILPNESECELESECNVALQIQRIGGTPYLVEVCCGGDVSAYQLTPVIFDANGNPVSAANGGASSFGGSTWDGIVSDANITCYADGATNYLVGRAIDFSAAVIDWTTAGVGALAGDYDEWLNVALLISDLVFGTPTLNDIRDYTIGSITTALTSATVTDALAANWTFGGTVTKDGLRSWVSSAPFIVSGVPVRSILNAWIDYSLLLGINNDLERIAAQCQSGNSIPSLSGTPTTPTNGGDWAVLFNFPVETGSFAPTTSGLWVNSLGWTSTDQVITGWERRCQIARDFTAADLTRVTMTYDASLGASPQNARLDVSLGGGSVANIVNAMQNGSGISVEWTGLSVSIDRVGLSIVPSSAATAGGLSGSGTIKTVVIEGTGSNPF